MDYARNLLLQRGRDAGGIASELVDLIEEEDRDQVLEQVEAEEDFDSDQDELQAKVYVMESEIISLEDSCTRRLQWAQKLAEALHDSLRQNYLPTVQKCRSLLDEFWKEHPKI